MSLNKPMNQSNSRREIMDRIKDAEEIVLQQGTSSSLHN